MEFFPPSPTPVSMSKSAIRPPVGSIAPESELRNPNKLYHRKRATPRQCTSSRQISEAFAPACYSDFRVRTSGRRAGWPALLALYTTFSAPDGSPPRPEFRPKSRCFRHLQRPQAGVQRLRDSSRQPAASTGARPAPRRSPGYTFNRPDRSCHVLAVLPAHSRPST